MTEKNSNLYEGMYIISARLSDDARKKALEKIKEGITSKGGEILKEHDLGRKRLAYEIDGHREGHYFVLYFNVDTKSISEMWHDYHLSEDLIRFVTLRTPKVMDKIEFKILADDN